MDYPIFFRKTVLIFDLIGVSKTHLASVIAHGFIERRIHLLFTPRTILMQKLQLTRKNLTLPACPDTLNQYTPLILNIRYVKKDEAEVHVLFELIAYLYESASLIFASN